MPEMRECFLQPPSKLVEAVAQIDVAANRALSGDLAEANRLLEACDNPEISEYVDLVAGKTNPDIHRYRPIRNAPPHQEGEAAHADAAAAARFVHARRLALPILRPESHS